MTNNQQGRRFRSATVTLGGAAIIAAGLSGCSLLGGDSDYAQTCVDDATNTRVTEDNCDRPYAGYGPRYSWFYVPFVAVALPGYGSSMNGLTGGTKSAPSSGSVSRGGFGSHSGGGSVGG